MSAPNQNCPGELKGAEDNTVYCKRYTFKYAAVDSGISSWMQSTHCWHHLWLTLPWCSVSRKYIWLPEIVNQFDDTVYPQATVQNIIQYRIDSLEHWCLFQLPIRIFQTTVLSLRS